MASKWTLSSQTAAYINDETKRKRRRGVHGRLIVVSTENVTSVSLRVTMGSVLPGGHVISILLVCAVVSTHSLVVLYSVLASD